MSAGNRKSMKVQGTHAWAAGVPGFCKAAVCAITRHQTVSEFAAHEIAAAACMRESCFCDSCMHSAGRQQPPSCSNFIRSKVISLAIQCICICCSALFPAAMPRPHRTGLLMAIAALAVYKNGNLIYFSSVLCR